MMIEINEENLDDAMLASLKGSYDYFKQQYEKYLDGETEFISIFSHDKAEDMSQLLNHCNALRLIIEWMGGEVEEIPDSKMTFVVEKSDGSAVYNMNFSKEEENALLRLGVITALERGIEEAKKYHPDYEETDE